MSETKLANLFNQYEELMGIVRKNRKQIRAKLSENQTARLAVDGLKKEIKQEVEKIMTEENKNLYQIAIESFGEIDKRFHILFTLLSRTK